MQRPVFFNLTQIQMPVGYDAATSMRHLTAPEVAAYRQQIDYWTDYFRHPSRNAV